MAATVEVLCHCCLTPTSSSLPVSCQRGHCDGLARYCSEHCRNEDCDNTGGGHGEIRCRQIQMYKETQHRIQIAACEGSYPEYDSASLEQPTGRNIDCSLGDTGVIVKYPNEIDAGGSLLVQLGNNRARTSKRFILCDVADICPQTPSAVHDHNMSEATRIESTTLWMKGVSAWYNEKDYLAAMKYFEQSLEALHWNDNVGATNMYSKDAKKTFYRIVLSSPPIRNDQYGFRTQIARRAHFLGACLLDAERIDDGRMWLTRSLLAMMPETSRHQSTNNCQLCGQQNGAAMELCLSFEEVGRPDIAQTVAAWTIDTQLGFWLDKYQRPGYIYIGHPNEECCVCQPHYDRDSQSFPQWCFELERHYDTILNEYLGLVGRGNMNTKANEDQATLHMPHTWPKVGSGEHRDSGHEDARVVNEGGDWREYVLFGSGCEHTLAPKTKALLRKYAPDVVKLAAAGGGEAIFSVLAPKTRIAPHCASHNVRLTAHIGLVIPDGGKEMVTNTDGTTRPKCGIKVGDQWHTWKRGETLLFDDSFEHSVVNDTDEVRAVLLLRFWNPLLVPKELESVQCQAYRI